MLVSQRKIHLLNVLKRDRRIVAKDVADELGLSEDTIRRDLRELAAMGKLQRVHGGALPASPAIADFVQRKSINHSGKAAIGRAAAAMLQPRSVFIIDGGTTAVQMARHIPRDLEATVITHSASVAVELVEHSALNVVLIGGQLYKHSIVSVGANALEMIARIKADAFFMGVTGVHPEAGLTTGDYEEAAVKRALSNAAAETIVLASAEKIGAASPFVILPVAAASTIITEAGVDADILESICKSGLSTTLV